MRNALTTLVVITIIAIASLAAMNAHGPVGPESIVGLEVDALVARSAARANASVSASTSANPNLLKLPPDLEPKRRVKRMLSKLGIVAPAPESAIQFTIRQQFGSHSVRCLIVFRGDHVIGIAVIEDGLDGSFTDHVQDALKAEFQGYNVQRLRETSSTRLQDDRYSPF
jgi:hypothetical protein